MKKSTIFIREICRRFPHGVQCVVDGRLLSLKKIYPDGSSMLLNFGTDEESNLPIEVYPSEALIVLRSIESMTEEEVDNLFKILKVNESGNQTNSNWNWIKVNPVLGIKFYFSTEHSDGKWAEELLEAFEYLDSIGIDYRSQEGLIESGLAVDLEFPDKQPSHPGILLKEVLSKRKVSNEEFAEKIGKDINFVEALLSGNEDITDFSDIVEQVTGICYNFWLNEQYCYNVFKYKMPKEFREEYRVGDEIEVLSGGDLINHSAILRLK